MELDRGREALLKLVGASVIFLSAIVQQFHRDDLQRRLDLMTEAIRDQALIEKGALSHQTSMYVLLGTVAVEQRQHLAREHARATATKLYQSIFPIMATVSSFDEEERNHDINTLRAHISSVSDPTSLSDYMRVQGHYAEKYGDALHGERRALQSQLRWSSYIYTGLYLLGGVLLFLAGWLDWRLSARPLETTPSNGRRKAKGR